MADLVKVFLQIPTAAVKGDYQAAVIYDPVPYNPGVNVGFNYESAEEFATEPFDYNILYKDCNKRPNTTEISTYELSTTQDQSFWNYVVPKSGENGYRYAHLYDYYLVRGFAVAMCGGLGTYGSQGFEICGFDLEAQAHRNVVEWLAGNRKAYSDPQGTNEVKADWSNHKIAMTGCSYGGTLPFEVASLGPTEGLVTIIPKAGIARWYDYTNSQGTTGYRLGRYMDYLASFNSGSLFLDDNWLVLNHDYVNFLAQINKDQNAANGNYTPIWELSDYTRNWQNLSIPALIVHGLNDFNVSTKQADLMIDSFEKAGQNVKVIWHLDGHNLLPVLPMEGGTTKDIANKWICHYLLGVENGIENMPEVLYQSNVDGTLHSVDHWNGTPQEVKATPKSGEPTSTVTSKGLDDACAAFATSKHLEGTSFADHTMDMNLSSEFYATIPQELGAIYDLDLPEGSTVYGTPTVSLKAVPTEGGYSGQTITAVLLDVKNDGGAFPAYVTMVDKSNRMPVKKVDTLDTQSGYGGTPVQEYVKDYTKAKFISVGHMDLANPGCGADPSDYAEDTNIEAGKTYDYTFYMTPTIYTLEPGHHLQLVLMTYDPMQESIVDDEEYVDYGFSADNSSIHVEIPVL